MVPNIDAMEYEELCELFRKLTDDPIGMAEKLFPEKPDGYITATETIRLYIGQLSHSKTLRVIGRVASALFHEKEAEGLYKTLPEYARW